jgi:hypothetical protein
MKRLLTLASFLILFFPSALTMAQNSSPYVVGQWNLNDKFKDFKHGDPIRTENSAFTFLNPTDLTLTLEYAFFASDGTFCGCDRDTLQPNGRTRYTMQAEVEGGQFSRTLCPTQTDGELKSIVFVASGTIGADAALQAGLEIHLSDRGQVRSESDLDAVPINTATIREMKHIHSLCVGFIGS